MWNTWMKQGQQLFLHDSAGASVLVRVVLIQFKEPIQFNESVKWICLVRFLWFIYFSRIVLKSLLCFSSRLFLCSPLIRHLEVCLHNCSWWKRNIFLPFFSSWCVYTNHTLSVCFSWWLYRKQSCCSKRTTSWSVRCSSTGAGKGSRVKLDHLLQ